MTRGTTPGWFQSNDAHMSKRPRMGGVEPYLLWPVRDRNALIRIIEAPTLARRADKLRPGTTTKAATAAKIAKAKDFTAHIFPVSGVASLSSIGDWRTLHAIPRSGVPTQHLGAEANGQRLVCPRR